MKCCRTAEEIKYFRFAPLAGSRFNALRIHEWGKRPGIENMPGLPFTNHSPRRSGRSSALPYPPGEQNDVNKLREWHQQEWRFDLSVAVKRNSRFHLKFVTSWFKNGGKPITALNEPGRWVIPVLSSTLLPGFTGRNFITTTESSATSHRFDQPWITPCASLFRKTRKQCKASPVKANSL